MNTDEFKLPEIINGKKIILVKRNHNYDDAMWKAIDSNRKFLREFLGWVDYVTTFDSVIRSTEDFLESWDAKEKFAYVIADINTKELLGCIDIHDIALKNEIASIGYWIKEDKTGFGYVTEAVKLLEAEVFKNKIHRLEIRCDDDNNASANVAIRCGYEYEAMLKENMVTHGKYKDQRIYVKFNPEATAL